LFSLLLLILFILKLKLAIGPVLNETALSHFQAEKSITSSFSTSPARGCGWHISRAADSIRESQTGKNVAVIDSSRGWGLVFIDIHFVGFWKRYIPESCQAFMHLKMVRFAYMEPLSFSCVSWTRPVMRGLFAVVLRNGGKTNGCQNDVMRIDATTDVDKDKTTAIYLS
jgi:hypothetical protein